jgi:ATP-dependent Clp protease adaptor protein ClpS
MSSSIVLSDVDEAVEVGDNTAAKLSKPYHLILLDDNDHTADYVVEMLGDLLGFSIEKAIEHTIEVDTRGHTKLATLPLAEAERKRDAIHGYGPDWRLLRCSGAMAALIEPAS